MVDWRGEQEVNEGNIALELVPPDPLELIGVVMAEESRQALGRSLEMLLIPLTVIHQQVSQGSWILCPILLNHGLLAEEPAIVVEVDELIEHVHACHFWDGTEEVAVGVGSENLRVADLLTLGCHVVCC